ncbi:hypothetical protein Tco_0343429 [Tanacetum coccineum]
MNEFDKFVAMERESLTYVYERFSTLINVMDQNKVCPSKFSVNTKFLNSLQPEWSKYVTMIRQKHILNTEEYDALYDYLSQFEPHVNASKAKKAARTMILLSPNIIPTNNHLRSSSNTRNQAVIHDGRMDIQSKNSIEEYDHNVQRNPRIASTLGKINVQCYNCNEKAPNKPWQVTAAVAAVRSARDEKVVLVCHYFFYGKPASETSELNPEDVTARPEDIEVEIDTLHADIKDKELLISELQDSLAAAENEIALLQIRVADAEDICVEDQNQINNFDPPRPISKTARLAITLSPSLRRDT